MPLEDILSLFPKVVFSAMEITSPVTDRYNCIAWAANDTRRWWWPDRAPNSFWPRGILRARTLEAFEEAFGTLGYGRCDAGDLEPALEKVAIYANEYGAPTHAARQLESGSWTSKLGHIEDIRHELLHLEGTHYGAVARFMRRPRPVPTALHAPTA